MRSGGAKSFVAGIGCATSILGWALRGSPSCGCGIMPRSNDSKSCRARVQLPEKVIVIVLFEWVFIGTESKHWTRSVGLRCEEYTHLNLVNLRDAIEKLAAVA
jgi:hypothetical protein